MARQRGSHIVVQLDVCTFSSYIDQMKLRAIIHEAEEGGFWAEVPSIPGCATQGETMEELLENLKDAAVGCLSIEVSPPALDVKAQEIEIAV